MDGPISRGVGHDANRDSNDRRQSEFSPAASRLRRVTIKEIRIKVPKV